MASRLLRLFERRGLRLDLVDSHVFGGTSSDGAASRFERIWVEFDGVSLSVPSVLSNDEEFVVVVAAGQGGVGVFAGEGVVREYEAAVDGRALGLVDSGRVTVGEVARLGVGARPVQETELIVVM